MPTYQILCPECGASYDQRLSFLQYEEVKTATKTLPCTRCGLGAQIAFNPGRVAFVLREGESGGWQSKSIKENAYRKKRREEMARREKDHVFKSNLQANYKGEETGTWREAQEMARQTDGEVAAATYDPLVNREQVK